MKIEKIYNNPYPYTIRFRTHRALSTVGPSWTQWEEMYNWCTETFGTVHETEGIWTKQWNGIRFKHKEHATWFILRWSGNDI